MAALGASRGFSEAPQLPKVQELSRFAAAFVTLAALSQGTQARDAGSLLALSASRGRESGERAARSPPSEVDLREGAARADDASTRPEPRSRAWRTARSEPETLITPVRCVSDYLEAVATAAPPRPRRTPALAEGKASERRWVRVRSYLSPRALAALDATARPQPLAPWSTLGRDGAFLGYELLAARRAPRGAVVVVSRERIERAPGEVLSTACAYLVGKVSGSWRIADERCGRDFPNGEVAANYAGYWDQPLAGDPQAPSDDWFGEHLE